MQQVLEQLNTDFDRFVEVGETKDADKFASAWSALPKRHGRQPKLGGGKRCEIGIDGPQVERNFSRAVTQWYADARCQNRRRF